MSEHDELLEAVAEVIYQAWSKWTIFCEQEYRDGSMSHYLKLWAEMRVAGYSELPSASKQGMRELAEHILALMGGQVERA